MAAANRKIRSQQPRVLLAHNPAEILRCFSVFKQLRPRITESQFVEQVQRQQSGGYSLSFVEEARRVRSVAGFRISENFYYGRFMYVDDLVTDEASQNQGYGSFLFDWLVGHAKDRGCVHLALDSGVQRFNAHRFYLGKRMSIVCHHFALALK